MVVVCCSNADMLVFCDLMSDACIIAGKEGVPLLEMCKYFIYLYEVSHLLTRKSSQIGLAI